MVSKALFERDLLYPTGNLFEFGSLHISIYSPNERIRVPVIIENKAAHSIIEYIETIVRIMQSDIFDRIYIDIKKSVDLYLISDSELLEKYGSKYVQIIFKGDTHEYAGVNAIG